MTARTIQKTNSQAPKDLGAYLEGLAPGTFDESQEAWFETLREGVEAGRRLYEESDVAERTRYDRLFLDWVRTEEVKAWYSEREAGSLFQGTSVTSLTIPCELNDPLQLESIEFLEQAIAEHFIRLHDLHAESVGRAILEDTDHWMSEGLYYGVVIGSKVLAQAFGLSVDAGAVVFPVDGRMVDPHEITTYPEDIREEYFRRCAEHIECLNGVPGLTRAEFESSLVLSDISKPRLEDYRDKLLLAPIRCNEICSLISANVTRLVRNKTEGRIAPRSLMVTTFDTDTPYTYHQINGHYGNPLSPALPGLTVLGTSGTIEAFRWLYAYRVSLISQKLMKSSLYSEVERCFVPFVFMGVLVERDAEILLDLENLGRLRYRGNVSPYMEFCYLLPKLRNYLDSTGAPDDDLDKRLR